MMKKFNWKDYYDLANELANTHPGKLASSKEAVLRTVISRAYYGAFIEARNYLRDKEGKHPDNKSQTHDFVARQFLSDKRSGRSDIGKELRLLRAYRNMADYDDVLRNPKNLARIALNLAQSIIKSLDKL